MGIRDWFKRKVEVRYVNAPPTFQPLGYMEGRIYFVNANSGKIYMLTRDRLNEHEVLQHVCTINSF